MHAAAQALIGKRDFSAFRDAQCQAPSPVREMRRIDVRRVREFIAIDVVGNAFLHHMVRNIVGTLIEVGQGRRPAQWVAEVRSEEHTYELQSLMSISYAVCCVQKKNIDQTYHNTAT